MGEQRFDNVGVFLYSCEDGTGAAALPGQVAKRVARDRYRRAMLQQQRISLAKNRDLVGQTLHVLIEGEATEPATNTGQEPLLVGRSYRHAPEIDGLVFARGKAPVGEMAAVRIGEATEYDLWGSVVEQGIGPQAAAG